MKLEISDWVLVLVGLAALTYFFGGDSLGRPILPRLLVGAQTTLMIAVAVVASSATKGATLRRQAR